MSLREYNVANRMQKNTFFYLNMHNAAAQEALPIEFGHPLGASPTTAWTVLRALRSLRIIRAGQDEVDLQDAIEGMLRHYGLPTQREYRFGPRCRADIWCDGVVVEIKKQRPVLGDLVAQITRYAAQPGCREIIVVLQRSVLLPDSIGGKPVHVLSLNSNWGVAL